MFWNFCVLARHRKAQVPKIVGFLVFWFFGFCGLPSYVIRHTSWVIRHTSDVRRHTSLVTRQTGVIDVFQTLMLDFELFSPRGASRAGRHWSHVRRVSLTCSKRWCLISNFSHLAEPPGLAGKVRPRHRTLPASPGGSARWEKFEIKHQRASRAGWLVVVAVVAKCIK